MTPRTQRQCVACDGTDLFDFYRAEGIPIDTGSLALTVQEAKDALCGELRLEFCRTCGTVHNRAFDPGLIRFAPGYDASLCYSPSFANALKETADELVARYSLHGKSVFEIGCGQAHLLQAICRRTSVKAVGIDPTAIDKFEVLGGSELRLIQSGLRRSQQDLLGDLVICISVIEDIEEPLNFLRLLRSMIGNRSTSLYFELFDGFGAIEAANVWSPHYEQCNYFSQSSICQLFQRANFKVVSSGRLAANDQYLYVAAAATGLAAGSEQGCSIDLSEQIIAAESFAHETQWCINKWSKQLSEWSHQRKRVVLWGAGGKAISFLSLIPEAATIQSVVDVNPNRQGRYTPKSVKRVISPAELRDERPEIIIMSNPVYRCEIELEIQRQGMSCRLVAA